MLAERPPLAELWFQTSAEYQALCYQTYASAERQLDRWAPLLVRRSDGFAYLPGATKPAAVILDLDETVIDNSGYQAFCAQAKTTYSSVTWAAWVEFQAINHAAGAAVPGAPEFLAKAKAMGVTPIYISNRYQGQEAPTIKVLEHLGIDVTDIDNRLALRPRPTDEKSEDLRVLEEFQIAAGSPEALAITQGEAHKEGRRQRMSQRYDIIAYFGDQLGDFTPYLGPTTLTSQSFKDRKTQALASHDLWGTRWFMLPNPMYGNWGPGIGILADQPERSLQDYGFGIYLRGLRAPLPR